MLTGDQVAGGMALAVDVTDRARLEEEQAALHAIAHVVAKGAELSHVLDLVATAVARLFGAVGAAVVRRGRRHRRRVGAGAGLPARPGWPIRPGPATAVGTVGWLGRPAVAAGSAEVGDPLTHANPSRRLPIQTRPRLTAATSSSITTVTALE